MPHNTIVWRLNTEDFTDYWEDIDPPRAVVLESFDGWLKPRPFKAALLRDLGLDYDTGLSRFSDILITFAFESDAVYFKLKFGDDMRYTLMSEETAAIQPQWLLDDEFDRMVRAFTDDGLAVSDAEFIRSLYEDNGVIAFEWRDSCTLFTRRHGRLESQEEGETSLDPMGTAVSQLGFRSVFVNE